MSEAESLQTQEALNASPRCHSRNSRWGRSTRCSGRATSCPGLSVEAVTVAEVLAQTGADPQPVGGVNAGVSAVEQGVDVGSEQEAVVQAALSGFADRADVSRLQDGPYLRAGDRAAAVVGIEHDDLERSLAKAERCQPRVAEHRPGTVSGLAEVEFECPAKEHLQKQLEIGRNTVAARTLTAHGYLRHLPTGSRTGWQAARRLGGPPQANLLGVASRRG